MDVCEIVYMEHVEVIKTKASYYSQITGRNFSDLFSVGNILFLKAWESWDPSKQSNFKTWLNWWLRGMLDEVKRLDLPPTVKGEPVNVEAAYITEPVYELNTPTYRESIEGLSDSISAEAKMVMSIVLNGPSDVLDVAEDAAPRVVRGALKAYLEELGLGWRAWRRIREEITSIIERKQEIDNGLHN